MNRGRRDHVCAGATLNRIKSQRTDVSLFHVPYSAITAARSPPQPNVVCAVEMEETSSPNIAFIGEDRVSPGRAREQPPSPLSSTPTRTRLDQCADLKPRLLPTIPSFPQLRPIQANQTVSDAEI